MHTTKQAIDTANYILSDNNIKFSLSDDAVLYPDHPLPSTVELYQDSILKLSPDSMPGFFQQIIDKKIIETRIKGGREVLRELAETSNHNLPKLMFVLLPVFALLLKLL